MKELKQLELKNVTGGTDWDDIIDRSYDDHHLVGRIVGRTLRTSWDVFVTSHRLANPIGII